MRQTDFMKAFDHIIGIERNYPYWDSTFGTCSNRCGRSGARGCGLCAYCHEEKLAEYVGEPLARKFHDTIKAKIEAYEEIRGVLCKDLT